MRRSLLVGINDYPKQPLHGSVNDALQLSELLCRHEDGSPNFECRLLLDPPDKLNRRMLVQAVEDLLFTEADAAVFYFSGHGAIDKLGGYLITGDAQTYSDGYPMRDLLALANKSPVREVLVILDCCHSGAFGAVPELDVDHVILREGMAVLAASRSSEPSVELAGSGVFTTLVCAALNGGAADVLGRVTVGSIYSYVDLALGAWDQRPMFKANLSRFLPIRRCAPDVDSAILRLLPVYFETPDLELELSPSYEPDIEPHDEKLERTFEHLQVLRDARLLVPVGEKHLYFAAMNSKSCKLTTLGQFYWQLAKQGRI